jgi:hypothetical protein
MAMTDAERHNDSRLCQNCRECGAKLKTAKAWEFALCWKCRKRGLM